jgi:hypothetical protein
MRTPARVRVLLLMATALVLVPAVPANAAGRTVHITKYDQSFTGVAGATFTLYRDDPPKGGGPPRGAEDTVSVGSCVTGANGQCDITMVPPGDYWVVETPPSGYTASSDSQLKMGKKNRSVTVSNEKNGTNASVNDPTGDASVDDGTHIFQFGPSAAVGGRNVLVAFNDSAGFQSPGGFSGVGIAVSNDRGRTFQDLGKLPPGSADVAILGEPSVAFDQRSRKFLFAAAGVALIGDTITRPILVSSYDPVAGTFGSPVNTYPDISPNAVTHGPEIVMDPENGWFYMSFIRSDPQTGMSRPMIMRSRDGGLTWESVRSIAGDGTNDFLDIAVDRRGYVNAVWSDYGGQSADTFDILFTRSTDGGRTFGAPVVVAGNLPKSGTPDLCGTESRRTILGQARAADGPSIAVDPSDPSGNTFYVAVARHGAGDDESDVGVMRTTDGGKTWSRLAPVRPTDGPQFYPSIEVSPDGRIGVGFYDRATPGGSSVNAMLSVSHGFGPLLDNSLLSTYTLNTSPAPLPQMNPGFDTNYTDCFGVESFGFAPTRRGFIVPWTDTTDPGPAGNNGVDPNIELRRIRGPFVPTRISLDVSRSSSGFVARGAVSPDPVVKARVTVTLLFDDGPGGFDVVDRLRPVLGPEGTFGVSITSAGGRCRLLVEFAGSEGRLPSSAVRTFAC